MESRYRGAGVGYGNLGARHAEVSKLFDLTGDSRVPGFL